jgi:rubrerythrin
MEHLWVGMFGSRQYGSTLQYPYYIICATCGVPHEHENAKLSCPGERQGHVRYERLEDGGVVNVAGQR